jgi:hypothetical protein
MAEGDESMIEIDTFILNTYNLQILSPAENTSRGDQDKRVLSNLPAMLEAVEEDLTLILPEGYTAKITERGADNGGPHYH